jgi:hypothetical protein
MYVDKMVKRMSKERSVKATTSIPPFFDFPRLFQDCLIGSIHRRAQGIICDRNPKKKL